MDIPIFAAFLQVLPKGKLSISSIHCVLFKALLYGVWRWALCFLSTGTEVLFIEQTFPNAKNIRTEYTVWQTVNSPQLWQLLQTKSKTLRDLKSDQTQRNEMPLFITNQKRQRNGGDLKFVALTKASTVLKFSIKDLHLFSVGLTAAVY